mmetsp:Transcript_35998/g.101352  ORF Transcript_35998/g.101352 Transcript_35998/m.101352 type:complete len:441 (-) Transcript_35998:9-1331(-)
MENQVGSNQSTSIEKGEHSGSRVGIETPTQNELEVRGTKAHAGFFLGLWGVGAVLYLRYVLTGLWLGDLLFNMVPLYDLVTKLTAGNGEYVFGWTEALGALALLYGLLYLIAFRVPLLANVLYKQRVWTMGMIGMALSRDFKWKRPPDPRNLDRVENLRRRNVVFIRHGESEWNEVFNRGFGLGFFVRLAKAIWKEILVYHTPDSVFLDASLCEEGMDQIRELQEFLEEGPQPGHKGKERDVILTLRGDKDVDNSVIVCSNLRRAIATAALGLQSRVQKTNEKIHILSCLQEISRNVDANAIAPPKNIPDLHVINHRMFSGYTPEKLFDASLNFGQKSLLGSHGFKRMREFCEWVFQQERETVIVGGGHSFFFRAFFQSFLDDDKHQATRDILHNAAVVTFLLESGEVDGVTQYRIPHKSLKPVFGGRKGRTDAFKSKKK